MSKKTKQKYTQKKEVTTISIISGITSIYIYIMFGLFPLYYQDRYYNMGIAKYHFFYYITMIFLIISLIAGFFYFIRHFSEFKDKKFLKSLTILDIFVAAYAVSLVLSYLLSNYKKIALSGYDGWFMGLICQLFFVGIYFFVSRFYQFKNRLLWIICISSGIVFLLGTLHRFLIDPLAMYEGLDSYYHILFLSTIGQATWYSSFLCTILPIGMYLYWSCTDKKIKPWLGLYCAIGFSSLVTQNSDSAFLGIGIAFFIFFWFSFNSNYQFLQFLEMSILCLITMRLVGFAQIAFPDKAVKLESISVFFSQNNLLWLLIIILVILYAAALNLYQKKSFDITRFVIIRKIFLYLLLVSVLLTSIFMYLVTNSLLPSVLSPLQNIGYLNFNPDWGNGRGFTWQYSASMFSEYPLIQKLFGVGPDCYAPYTYEFHESAVSARWGSDILANAHNEWFNILLTLGIAGFVSYLGIFLFAFNSFLKKASKEPFLIAISACILSYMLHNLFCYQQVICTPFIFMLLGIGNGFLIEQQKGTH